MAVHLLAGIALALLLSVIDMTIGRALAWGAGGMHPLAVVKATLSLAALSLPVGATFGLCMSLLTSVLRPLPWYAHTRDHLAHPRRWFLNAPSAFAWLLAVLLVLPLLFAGMWRAALHFATAYHNPELASLGLALCSLIAFLLAALSISALQPPLTTLGARLGRVGSTGTVVALALLFALVIGVALWLQRRDLFAVFDVRLLSELSVALLVYPLLLVWLERVLPRRRRVWLAAVAVLISFGALSLCATLYSQSHRVRHLVERETSYGITLLHRYADLADTDHDGYAFLFGGGDCDDGNPRVHPGAAETPNDGVDSNCAAGDSDPDVSDYGDGVYGLVPNALGRPNILVITIDALRPDRLGAYNPTQRKVSPNIDRFAKGAVRFNTAMSPSSRSIRSIPAMWIGAYPSQVAFGPEHLWPTLLEENVTAAELLQQHGYQTFAAIGTSYFSNMPEFFQGFGQVDDAGSYKPSRKHAVTSAINMLDKVRRKRKPWLGWVHLFNVHEPYLHDYVKSKFGTGRLGSYDTEVAFADEQVGRLLKWLDESELASNTVVVIASDHGEAFMEHGTIGHSYSLYDEELRSTLLVRVPGQAARVIDTPVSLIDLAPTVLNLAGVPLSRPLPSRSLVPLIMGEHGDAKRALYGELMPDGSLPHDEKCVIVDGWKLIWWLREGSIQLFDLKHDPGEEHDLADTERARAHQLLTRLRSWVAQTSLRENRRDNILEQHRLSSIPTQLITQINADYGPFMLVGYQVKSRHVRPGDKLVLELYFQVREQMREDYFFEVSFKGPPTLSIPRYLQAAHYPLNGAYRTFEWKPGERLRDPIQITIPSMTPVTLDMRLRIYRRGPQRVTLQAPGTHDGWLPLGQVHIRK